MKRLFTLFALCVMFSASPVFAQDTKTPVPDSRDIHPGARFNYSSGIQYEKTAKQALSRPVDFNFGDFRLLYTMTRAYDPLGEATQRRLLKLSQSVQNAKTPEAAKKALAGYTGLVLAHLANIDVVSMAQGMAAEDPRFGDPEFFKWMYRGLLGSTVQSGDGSTLDRAYDALVMGEETALLGKLGVRVLASRHAHEGIIYYNEHEVQEIKTGKRRVLFVDTTTPMTYFAWEKSRRPAPTIPLPQK